MADTPIPAAFEARMRRILGEEYPAFVHALLDGEPVRSLRVNTRKIAVEDFLALHPYSLTPVPFAHDGFYLGDDVRMGGEVYHQAGMFYMQEPSAMMPVNAAPLQKGWRVMDLCAAPGGKTSQLATAVGDEGLVVANDVKFERCKALCENIERLGLENVIITSSPADELCALFHAYFDLVLVDATCSGEGMFRKNDNLMAAWSQKKVDACAEIQRGLLKDVADTVKPGGYILYSTCTFASEEDEETVAAFLASDARYSLCPVSDGVKNATAPGLAGEGNWPLEETRRVYPHLARGEGQFVALLRRNEVPDEASVRSAPDRTHDDERARVQSILADWGLTVDSARIYIRGESVWLLPQNALLLKKNVLAHGVAVGTLTREGLTPCHTFFMAYGTKLKSTLPLLPGDAHLEAYLRGEDIAARVPDGYGTVTVHGCSLGGYRARGGKLKNLYPRNLTNKEYL